MERVLWYLGHSWQDVLPISSAYIPSRHGLQTGTTSLNSFPLTMRERSVWVEICPFSQLTV